MRRARASSVAARLGAGFEQVEQAAVLEQQLLARRSPARARRRSCPRQADDRDQRQSRRAGSRRGHPSRRGRRRDPSPSGSRASRRPERSPRPARSRRARTWPASRAHDAAPPARPRSAAWPGVEGKGPTAAVRRTRNRRSRSNASDAARIHSRTGPVGAMVKRQLEQPRVTPVDVAQQMHRVGEVARGMAPAPLGQRQRMAMPRQPDRRDPEQLTFRHRHVIPLQRRIARHTESLSTQTGAIRTSP